MPYRLSSRAEQDLDEVWLCVAEDASPTTADRLIDDLIDRFDLLVEQPWNGTSPSGVRTERDPSSELKMHLEVYRNRPDARAVVHAHPPTATGFAGAGIALDRAALAEVIQSCC